MSMCYIGRCYCCKSVIAAIAEEGHTTEEIVKTVIDWSLWAFNVERVPCDSFELDKCHCAEVIEEIYGPAEPPNHPLEPQS